MSVNNSARECVVCKDIHATYLLPCMHPICAQCLDDVAQDAKQAGRKSSCIECGELFVQELLDALPSMEDNYQGQTEVLVCEEHAIDTEAFCFYCELPVCPSCVVNHSDPPHSCLPFKEAAKDLFESLTKTYHELSASINGEIIRRQSSHKKLKDSIDLQKAKLEETIKNEKVEMLQIEDLEKANALLNAARIQGTAFGSIASTFPSVNTQLQLQSRISKRVLHIQEGVSPMIKVTPVAVFDYVYEKYISVSNNRKTIKNKSTSRWGFGLSGDGCFSGSRSWHITLDSTPSQDDGIMIGIWNSSEIPSTNASKEYAHLFYCSNDPSSWKLKGTIASNFCRSGDNFQIHVDATQRQMCLWNCSVQRFVCVYAALGPPNPAYCPYVILSPGGSVTINSVS